MAREMSKRSWIICTSVLLLAVPLYSQVQGADVKSVADNNDQGNNVVPQKLDSSNINVPNSGSTSTKPNLATNTAPYRSTCGEPPPDACASIKTEQTDTFGDVASYTCKSPYKLAGQQSLMCYETRSWGRINATEDWPSCKVDCGATPNEPMALVSARGYGSYSGKVPWATYVCDEGYVSAVSIKAKNVTCDPYTLEWNQPMLHCTALQSKMIATMTIGSHPSILVDGNVTTCLNVTETGSVIITFYMPTEVYSITLRARSLSDDISVNMTLKNDDTETAIWMEPRILSTFWANGKVFPWTDRRVPLVGTSLNMTIVLPDNQTKLELCEVEVNGRPTSGSCDKPPLPGYGQQLKSVKSDRCVSMTGPCSLGAQLEYECQKGFLQTSGESVIECDYRNWTQLTLNCVYAPVVKVLQDSADVNKCTPVSKRFTVYTMDLLELQYAVVNISVANTTNARNIIATGDSQVVFEYIMSLDKNFPCDNKYNVTIGTSLYAFVCPKRPVPKSVQVRFTNENATADISICFVKVVVRNYDKALECVQDSAPDYKGHLNVAYTGETCDLWSSHLASNQTIKGESLDSAGNFCRNLNNDRDMPWCFVNGTAKSCPVIACNQACLLPWSADGAQYVGQQDFEMETGMFWKCIGWNETSQADVCPVLQKSLFFDSNPNTNYCRNPDRRTTGPWCKVRPCLQGGCSPKEMSCRIPTCPNTDQIQSGTINVLNDTEKVWLVTVPMVECWLYSNNSMKRHEMPQVRPVSMDAIDSILRKWCDMNYGHSLMATCHNSTNWHRIMLLCEMDISSSIEWTSSVEPTSSIEWTSSVESTSSILPTLLTEDISSSFFIKETPSATNTLMSPSITSLHDTTSQTEELTSFHNWFTHSTEPSQTVANPGHPTIWQSEIKSSSNSMYDYISVASPSSAVTLQSGIRPSPSSTLEHTAQTVSVNPGEITILDIKRTTTTELNLTQTTTNAIIGQKTSASGTSPSTSPTPERTTPKNHCPCWCSSDMPADSLQESATKAAKLSDLLQVQKGNLSSTINRKISKDDKRVSARLLSSVFALVIIVMFVSLIIVPDVLSFIICVSHRRQSDELASAPKK